MGADGTSGPTTTELAEDRTDLALERSRMAADRTIMAFMRTATALIAFGFTIYKTFDYLGSTQPHAGLAAQGPRNLGIALLALGAGMLLLGILQHMSFVKRLRQESGMRLPVSIPLIGAIVLLIIAALALIDVVLQIGPFQ